MEALRAALNFPRRHSVKYRKNGFGEGSHHNTYPFDKRAQTSRNKNILRKKEHCVVNWCCLHHQHRPIPIYIISIVNIITTDHHHHRHHSPSPVGISIAIAKFCGVGFVHYKELSQWVCDHLLLTELVIAIYVIYNCTFVNYTKELLFKHNQHRTCVMRTDCVWLTRMSLAVKAVFGCQVLMVVVQASRTFSLVIPLWLDLLFVLAVTVDHRVYPKSKVCNSQ